RYSAAGDRQRISRAMADLRATATTMRGFFLADPDELSLLVYVEQFSAGEDPAKRTMYRLRGGNDRLPERMARALHTRVRLHQAARRIVQNQSSVRVTVENARGRRTEIGSDYAIVAVPAPLAAEIEYAPALPASQRDALARLRYGARHKDPASVRSSCVAPRWTAARVRDRSQSRGGVG
ncbi:MAG TPA: FAD-dependent oxidoreductase, partial [Burkholderiales bacterium]|nr:FAD-dependent oxidoreductase [Burkholderiales bacterium]